MSDEATKGIEDWRRKIDKIDCQLVDLLNERSRCALAIGQLKRQHGITIYQPDREGQVLENAERANRGPLSDTAIRRLFERVLDEARSLERQERSEGTAGPGRSQSNAPKRRDF